MKHVLVVDDEPSITTLLKYNLEKEGYTVTVAYDGKEALQMALTDSFDCIVLDLMLPKLDGFEVTKALRSQQIRTPILMLTAKDDVVDKIVGLEMGADDYLTKPFSPRELVARMKAIDRRLNLTKVDEDRTVPALISENAITIGEITIYPLVYQVVKKENKIQLTKKEFDLLLYFMKRQNRVIDRETLLYAIWGNNDFYGQTRTVDIHVSHLREKIEDNPKQPEYLVTVRGFGYKFQDPKSID